MAALFLDVPGADVDVNVHPQKLEVRFARAQEVYAAVRHVVGAAIARAPWLRTADDRPMRTFTQPPRMELAGAAAPGPSAMGAAALALPRAAQSALPLRARDLDDDSFGAPGADAVPLPAAPRFFADLNYVGQVHRTYLVCEAPDELILIDQHAAHERVAYARLRAAHARRQMARQQLLFPIPIEVGEAAAAALETDDVLGGLGFEVARQGPSAILLRAVPEPLKDADPKPLIRELLSDLVEGTPLREGELDRVDHLLATIACHSVVRAGDVLSRTEALALLGQLDAVDLRLALPARAPGAAAPAARRDRAALRPCLSHEPALRFVAVLGPTASGKSALGLALAERAGGEIVACDSQQVYVGMDIGTAKPTADERRRVPHHALDLVRPDEAFHAARWAAVARAAIADIVARGRLPIVVGGTGLYYRALVAGLFEAPPPDEGIRARHRAEAAAGGVEALHARLAGVDPEAAAAIRPRDLLRISRALEIYEQTGEPITTLRGAPRPPPIWRPRSCCSIRPSRRCARASPRAWSR